MLYKANKDLFYELENGLIRIFVELGDKDKGSLSLKYSHHLKHSYKSKYKKRRITDRGISFDHLIYYN